VAELVDALVLGTSAGVKKLFLFVSLK